MELYIENLRCFRKPQRIPIRPITLLVGENSTGKSTVLAAYRLAWDAIWGAGPVDLNEPPFELGNFDQVVSRTRKLKQKAHFAIGGKIPVSPLIPASAASDSTVTYRKGEVEPQIVEYAAEEQSGRKLIYRRINGNDLEIARPAKTGIQTLPKVLGGASQLRPPLILVPLRVEAIRTPGGERIPDIAPEVSIERWRQESLSYRPRALAPIRSRPERIYDKMFDHPQSTGDHIVRVLAKAMQRNGGDGTRLLKGLNQFGVASGLFEEISIRRLGSKDGDPVQVEVGKGSEFDNLIDVGYGVSQVLPILVDSLSSVSGSTFLMQQPEVHLHPRAQAELGSFLCNVALEQKKTFLIETHSDYMLDRIRLDIRDKRGIKPKDVALLYFEKDKTGVTIHHIELDEMGNLLNAPKNYRSFFLKEEMRFFGV